MSFNCYPIKVEVFGRPTSSSEENNLENLKHNKNTIFKNKLGSEEPKFVNIKVEPYYDELLEQKPDIIKCQKSIKNEPYDFDISIKHEHVDVQITQESHEVSEEENDNYILPNAPSPKPQNDYISYESNTDSEHQSGVPGPSIKETLRTGIVHKKCVTYSRQDLKPSESQLLDNESRMSNKVPKTSAERGREYRARKALLKQSKREQEPAIAPEIRVIEKKVKSAEATRRWREKKRVLVGYQRKHAKTAAERMREYRQRKKLRHITGKLLSKQQNDSPVPTKI